MSPLIEKGDFMTVAPANFNEIKVGDIVVYDIGKRSTDTLTAHRVMQKVWWKKPPFLIIRSDSHGWVGGDFPVYSNGLYGRVVKVEKKGAVLDLDCWKVRSSMSSKVRWVRGQAALKRVMKNPLQLLPAFGRRFSFLVQRLANQNDAKKNDRSKLSNSTSILEVSVDGGFFLIPVIAGAVDMQKIFGLNETGTLLWKLLKDKNIQVITARQGQRMKLSDATYLNILLPSEDFSGKSPKNIHDAMIVSKLSYGSTTALLMGDAEKLLEYELLSSGVNLKSDILKAGHHGSKTSSSEYFLRAVVPRFAVISVGKKNRYGHPHQEVLDRLKSFGILTFRTDENGDARFVSDGKAFVQKEQ